MREAAKAVLRLIALVFVSPLLLWYVVLRLVLGRDRAVEDTSQIVSLFPGLAGQYVRRAVLSCTLAECHASCVIGFGTVFSSADARVGARAYIGPYCTIGRVEIRENALIAAGVHIPSGPRTHGISRSEAIIDQPAEPARVIIGRGSWIGNNAVVMADVGEDSIVGAGAVVTHPVPPSVVAAGVPARVVKTR